jgi:hypothetical protein
MQLLRMPVFVFALSLGAARAAEPVEPNPPPVETEPPVVVEPQPDSAEVQPAIEAPPPPVEEEQAPKPPEPAPQPSPEAKPPAPPAIVTAAFGKGATIASPDGNYSMTLRGRVQVRFTQLDKNAESGEPSTELSIRRMRLKLDGNAFSPSLRYTVQLAFSNLDQEPDLRTPLRDAYLTWTAWKWLELKLGQMKVPFDRQRVTSSSSLQMVDRSPVVAELNLDRDVGFQIGSRDLFDWNGVLAYQAGIFGGDGRNRLATTSGLLYVARVQVSPLGGFDDDSIEADLSRDEKPRLAIGIGGAYNRKTTRARSTFDTTFKAGATDQLHGEADLVFKSAGFSLLGEVLYRQATDEVLVRGEGAARIEETTRSAWGAFAQGGYLFTDQLEVVGRYSALHPLGVSAVHTSREVALGINYYVQRHDLKVQADYAYLFGDVFAGGTNQVRVQAQLYF